MELNERKVTPTFWLHLIERCEYRDAFFWYYGIPGFEPARSILIFITQIGISSCALLFGSDLSHRTHGDWWQKMIVATVINCLLKIISIKMLQCTNKRHTLSQKQKKMVGYASIFRLLDLCFGLDSVCVIMVCMV